MSAAAGAKEIQMVISLGEQRQASIMARQNQLTQALTSADTEYTLLQALGADKGRQTRAVEAINALARVSQEAFSTVVVMSNEFGLVNGSAQTAMQQIMDRNTRFFLALDQLKPDSTRDAIDSMFLKLRDANPRVKQMLGIFYKVLSTNLAHEREQMMKQTPTS